ncbi:uncharacterized protein HMPREF1541_04006 [Cyphellophora europaea CBS 101466]|uniref:CCAAT-binding factor domain-containing protein n=1 Tax=Cyphellophora europaea (strain CBS 101466) TaxID=1220924 RepID=W2S054_CYPE1|nr:uncharacterized protein HMPREF1541_04006 [Cyphellophora europaea CBS 101466]ETN42067.1 hypothetical protein HMPREF1541_04006 [Cyphellophora europaea CBS 101466]
MSKENSQKTQRPPQAASNNVPPVSSKPKTTVQPRQSFGQLKENIAANLKKSASKKTQSQKVSEASQDARGKKRNSQGQVKPQNMLAQQQQQSFEEDEFQAEVRALGGDRDDLVLLAGIESESEVEGTNNIDQKPKKKGKSDLEKGMQNILDEIALAQGSSKAEAKSQDVDETDVISEAESSEEEEAVTEPSNPQPHPQRAKFVLHFEPRPDWFAVVDSFANMEVKAEPSTETVQQVSQYAKGLLEEENERFKKPQKASSSQSFYNTVIQSGTLSDKISALTLAAQESPVHNIQALETLLGLAGKRSRSQAVDVLRALKDLFAQGSLLPADRRLYTLATQPGVRAKFGKKAWAKGDKLPKGVEEVHLIAWAFEDWLKGKYFDVIKILEVWCNDEIEFAKSRAISYVYELLKEKPEQEANLLRLLINKLGDPVKKIASQASYLLMQLLTIHPAMKGVVISAIETEIFRPGQALHQKYYATVTINQTALSGREEELAGKLLGIYFGLFSQLIKTSDQGLEDDDGPKSTSREHRRRQARKSKKATAGPAQADDLREKLTSALLTGVNRAYPYAGSESKTFAEHLDTLFKIVHSANFNTSIQAMLLIQQLSGSHQASNDRFYRVLYESLLDQRLITASKQQLYLNLLHRSLKADINNRRVKAFVKRILQVLSLHEAPFICGAFYLLKDLDTTFPGLTALTDNAEELDEEEEVFKDVDEDRAQPVAQIGHADKKEQLYDGHKRAPEHANADKSCTWELLPFLAHYHPSVTLSADHYLQHQKLPGKPDLALHTLMHFLDRFVYKNAKLSESRPRGASIMQPMYSDNNHNVLIAPTVGGAQRMSVTSEEFKSKQDKDVAADDVFFHKYFANLSKENKSKGKKPKADYDVEPVSDDEDAIWDAMMKSAPELEGAEESDDDLSMSDLESAMASDDDDEDHSRADQGEGVDESDDGGVDVESGIFDDSDEQMAEEPSDEDMPDFGEIDPDDEVSDGDEVVATSATPAAQDKSKKRGKKLKALPMFASADDYAKLLDDEEDEDLG